MERQDTAEHGTTEHGMAGQGITWHSKARKQGMAGQSRTWNGRTRQSMVRQGKARKNIGHDTVR